MAQATISLSPNLDLEHALRIVCAAGYRVTKPKRKLTSRGAGAASDKPSVVPDR